MPTKILILIPKVGQKEQNYIPLEFFAVCKCQLNEKKKRCMIAMTKGEVQRVGVTSEDDISVALQKWNSLFRNAIDLPSKCKQEECHATTPGLPWTIT